MRLAMVRQRARLVRKPWQEPARVQSELARLGSSLLSQPAGLRALEKSALGSARV